MNKVIENIKLKMGKNHIVKEFTPIGKTFRPFFDTDEEHKCYHLLNNVNCPVNLKNVNNVDSQKDRNSDKGSSMYCLRLAKAIMEKRKLEDILIFKLNEDLFDVFGGDGRHRMCILQHLNDEKLTVTVTVNMEKFKSKSK